MTWAGVTKTATVPKIESPSAGDIAVFTLAGDDISGDAAIDATLIAGTGATLGPPAGAIVQGTSRDMLTVPLVGDMLLGGADSDLLIGENGRDVSDRPGGREVIEFGPEIGTRRLFADSVAGHAIDTYGKRDTFRNIENLSASCLADTVPGDDGDNIIW